MYTRKEKSNPQGKEKRTELSELGEFGLIDHLSKNIVLKHTGTVKGIGDDAAVLDSGNELLLLSTDLLLEGVHFDLTYMPLKHLGYKAAIVNISDIAAMNGVPKQMTVSIAVSNRFSLEAIDELYKGIRMACDKYNVDLVGGDTSSSVSGLLISITITGAAAREEIVYRNGAHEGDLLCVTGNLGGAYAGLLILEREKKVYQANPDMQPELTGCDYVLARQLKPEARTDIRNLLKEAEVMPTSMIDISDGLASETLHLCHQSKTGCRIYEEKIPMDEETRTLALEFNIIPTVCALSGGEDYELLFTIKQDDYEKIRNIQDITVIGHMTAYGDGQNLITPDGKTVQITAQGWNAFAKVAK
ncbi:MAG: thiamine-phosphate kinase [Bacteroidetes bacterium]|nr:thiamine-phosphate kinase [Bacteroidota bacterium]